MAPINPNQRDLGTVFAEPGVAAAYRHRPPYPDEVFDVLEQLVVDEPRRVLDIGAGEGALARPLAERVDQVDAVDPSAAMIAAGRQRAGGAAENLRWIESTVECSEVKGPYALVTAGACMHWLRWPETMNRLSAVMTANAHLAIIEHGPENPPWHEELVAVIKRHSRNPGYDPGFSSVEALRQDGLFETAGRVTCGPVPFRQAVVDYVEQFHSTSSLAREHMSRQEALDFDRAVEAVVRPFAGDGVVELSIVATLTWGRPR